MESGCVTIGLSSYFKKQKPRQKNQKKDKISQLERQKRKCERRIRNLRLGPMEHYDQNGGLFEKVDAGFDNGQFKNNEKELQIHRAQIYTDPPYTQPIVYGFSFNEETKLYQGLFLFESKSQKNDLEAQNLRVLQKYVNLKHVKLFLIQQKLKELQNQQEK